MVSPAVVLVATLLATQAIELYRARFRPAHELVSIAESALGDGGHVTLEARTATLVLNGTPDAIRRAVALLERVDRPLRQVVLESTVREIESFDAFVARVQWQTSLGPVRVGTLPSGPDGLAMRAGADRTRGTTTSRSSLRLVEGSSGIVRSGRALPVLFSSYWAVSTEFVPVETGFEATVRVLDGDRVFLELRPFAGDVGERGDVSYIAASTSITVAPGETVVLAEASRASESTSSDLSGASREATGRRQLILILVELER